MWEVCVQASEDGPGAGVHMRGAGVKGVPDLPGAPQDEAGLMRKFET